MRFVNPKPFFHLRAALVARHWVTSERMPLGEESSMNWTMEWQYCNGYGCNTRMSIRVKFDNRSGDVQGKSLGKASRASYRRDAKGWGDACKEGLDRAKQNTNFMCQNAFKCIPYLTVWCCTCTYLYCICGSFVECSGTSQFWFQEWWQIRRCLAFSNHQIAIPTRTCFSTRRDAFLICAVADIFYFAVESNYCQDILQPPTLLHTVRRLSARLRLEEMEVFVRQWVEHSQAEIRTDYFLLPFHPSLKASTIQTMTIQFTSSNKRRKKFSLPYSQPAGVASVLRLSCC